MSGFLSDISAVATQATRQQTELAVERIRARQDDARTINDTIAEQRQIDRQDTFSPRLQNEATQDALSRLAFEDRLNSQTNLLQDPDRISEDRQEALAQTAANPTSAADQVIQDSLPPGVGGSSTEFQRQIDSNLETARSVDAIVGDGVNSILANAVAATEDLLAQRLDPGSIDVVPDGPGPSDIQLQVFGNSAGDNVAREQRNEDEINRQREIQDRIDDNVDRQLREQEEATLAYEARRLSEDLRQQQLDEDLLRDARFEASAERRLNLEA